MYFRLSLEQDPKDLQYWCTKLFVCSRPFSLLQTRSSATFEVSTTPVAKLTRDSISWTKGYSLNQRKNSQLAYWRLLDNASLSSMPLPCFVTRSLSVRTAHLSQRYEAIWWIVRNHLSSDLGLSWDPRKCLITAANGVIFSNKFLIHFWVLCLQLLD